MHEFTFSGISSQRYAILDRKIDLKKINSKTDFQNRKPDFGFQTENRISGFRLTSLVVSMHGASAVGGFSMSSVDETNPNPDPDQPS